MPARTLLAALAAASLAATPAAAQPPRPEPAPEVVEGSELRGERTVYFVLPILVLLAILVAVLRGEEGPTSP